MSLFYTKDIVEEFRVRARGISPEFSQSLDDNFLTPYFTGCRFYSIRKAMNLYLHMAVGMIADPSIDQIDIRRCLSDEGDQEAWLNNVELTVFPLISRYRSIPHWSQVAPASFR